MSTQLTVRDAPAILERNRAALRAAQPWLEVGTLPAGPVPADGRDGSPTFRVDGKWWRECSVPTAASRAMLESLRPTATVAFYLAPMHPAAIKVALDILGEGRVLIANVEEELELFLACEDFAIAIAEGRLRVVHSVEKLAELLERYPGLPTPELLVRTMHVPPDVNAKLVESVQRELAAEQDRRTQLANSLRTGCSARSAPPKRLLVGGPSRFRLWDDAGETLLCSVPAGVTTVRWRTDDPWQSTLLHLLDAIREVDAIVAADFFRADAAGALPENLPIISWATKPRIAPGGPHDKLLLADPDFTRAAHAAGWRQDQIALATRAERRSPRPPGKHLALIADLTAAKLSAEIEDFSSHRLACERIQSELERNPFRAGSDIAGYVDAVRASMGIPAEGFPADAIVENWALPLWQASVVRRLSGAGLPVEVHGRGWDAAENLGATVRGPVTTRAAFLDAVDAAAAVLAPAPGIRICDGYGRPVVQAVQSLEATAKQLARAASPGASQSAGASPSAGAPAAQLLLTRLAEAIAALGQGATTARPG